MTRQQALAWVAGTFAGMLQAGTLDEVLEMSEDQMSQLGEADLDRLTEAVETVIDRLNRMGRKR